jgi:hypothetical protein
MHQSKPQAEYPSQCLIYVIDISYSRNLCYISYLESHEPITSAAFEAYWKGLTKAESKHWMNLSRSKKACNDKACNEAEASVE